ncbi:protease synthase and sporulation protein PAI 2 [mine drainage metagenome]|uniref:Protease synthase and sporulation protein PAI 2 n=1 Tax=mine drainage metagenome TaxID=410659 RepID=A0A1J5RF24_9ZZZZ
MYIPEHFRETDSERISSLIAAYPFGALVTAEGGPPMVSHLPFLFEPDSGHEGKLLCHLARANPQCRQLIEMQAQGKTVLAVFQGPHAYVSPSWYAGPGVPTWNYAAVHVYGRVRLIEAETELKALLEKLTRAHEANIAEPWTGMLPEQAPMLRMILGLEIEVTEIQGKFKLSQNRSAEDQRRVIRALEDSASPLETGVSALMAANLANKPK